MVEADAFLATILERPDDDAPRLVFADWLEEQGDNVRAEFIRVQIELAHKGAEPHRRSFLKRREKDLFERHRKEWLRPLYDRLQAVRDQTTELGPSSLLQLVPNILGPRTLAFRAGLHAEVEAFDFPPREEMITFLAQMLDPFHLHLPLERLVHSQFRRGFVETMTMPASDFVRFAETLLALVPLRDLQASGGPFQRGFVELFACPHLRRLAGLHLIGLLFSDLLEAFLDSPNLTELRSLDLHDANIPHEQCEQLLDARNLPAVQELNLATLQIGNFAVATLARNVNWQNLQVLNLSQTGLGDEGVLALCGAGRVLSRLTHLNLSRNSITSAGVVFLAHSGLAARLQDLDLGHNHLSDSWVESLSRWPVRFLGRRSLSPWVQQLLDSPLTVGLKRLNLGGHMLPREDRLALQECFGQRLTWDV